jgi:DNA-binding MarR family transcriptional regulator
MSEQLPPLDSALWSDWVYFLRAYKVVIERVSQDLADAGMPTLIEYSVLWWLSHAEDRRLRLVDLSKGVLVSKSRVTRLMNSLVEEGYVRREQDQSDKRVTYAVLTSEGLEALERATPTFAVAFNKYFASRLEGRQGEITRILDSMATQLEPMPPRSTGKPIE